jgi:geranyl-CoA carboxylase alpha subunit
VNTFNSILIANRGEIAVRVMQTASALGYRSIAVYSEADALSPHVRQADEAVCIGPPPVAQSYLDIERILAAARETNAGAIHPGYGFLSENSEFAAACEAAGIVYIGPSAAAVELMANKARAKAHMALAGVPCVPGYAGEDPSDDAFIEAASRIGYPVMIKAAAGGGGRGMRQVDDPAGLTKALARARSEAQHAFGSDEVILEKALQGPRHVEVQIMADEQGHVIHLGERDCSVQRRHQKVIEEAPCPAMTDKLRFAMGETAVTAAKSIGYRGAGTVEFLLDEGDNFFFLEMNTRLQVEHPVTEMITGLDLVAMQIDIAQGLPLTLTQADVQFSGHAIEARLYAEDVGRGFLPCTGTVALWQPSTAEHIRIDAGIDNGLHIGPHYDPMLAKFIAWGEDRESARCRLADALKMTVLFGLTTNRSFLVDALNQQAFAVGCVTTAFIEQAFGPEDLSPAVPSVECAAVAAVIQYRWQRDSARQRALWVPADLLDWSSTGSLVSRYRYVVAGNTLDLNVRAGGEDYRVRCESTEITVRMVADSDNKARIEVNGCTVDVVYESQSGTRTYLFMDGEDWCFDNQMVAAALAETPGGDGRVLAPMHGRVTEIMVEAGDVVRKGQRLASLEAMKMEHEIDAPVDGTVDQVVCTLQVQVAIDDVLFEII